MRDLIFPIFLLALAAASPFAVAKGGGLHGSYSAATHSKTAPWVHRDSHGKIARDTRQTEAFKKQRPCPSHRQVLWFLHRLRHRPRHPAETRWPGRAKQHAVADRGGGEAERQMGVSTSICGKTIKART